MYLLKNVYEEHISSEEIKAILEQEQALANISFWAFVKHNADINPNGEIKKSHYHIIIEWCGKKSHHLNIDIVNELKPIWKGAEAQAQVEAIRSIQKQMRYLRHLDNLEKTPYSLEEIISSDLMLYQEYCEKQVSQSESDVILEEFMCWAENPNADMNSITFLKWWRAKGKLSYYMTHKRQIEEIAWAVHKDAEEF